jgi:Protein of unknown function (DUF3263)
MTSPDAARSLLNELLAAADAAELVDDIQDEALSSPALKSAAELRDSRIALSQRDQDMIAFERQWWRNAGAKEQAIRDTFGLSTTRYYQVLNGLLDHPAALAFDPMVVKRLRRLRTSRDRSRGRRLD